MHYFGCKFSKNFQGPPDPHCERGWIPSLHPPPARLSAVFVGALRPRLRDPKRKNLNPSEFFSGYALGVCNHRSSELTTDAVSPSLTRHSSDKSPAVVDEDRSQPTATYQNVSNRQLRRKIRSAHQLVNSVFHDAQGTWHNGQCWWSKHIFVVSELANFARRCWMKPALNFVFRRRTRRLTRSLKNRLQGRLSVTPMTGRHSPRNSTRPRR